MPTLEGTQEQVEIPAIKSFFGQTRRDQFGACKPKEDEIPKSCCRRLFEAVSTVVRGSAFDHCIGLIVVFNAVAVGVQIDFAVKHPGRSVPSWLRVCEVCFCGVFALELILRLCVFGCAFFTGPDRRWNWFDMLCVSTEIVEELIAVARPSDRFRFNVTFARVLFLLRLVRIGRTVRLLRLIVHFRTLVISLRASISHFVWTVVLLGILTYVLGVSLTQIVADHERQRQADAVADTQLLLLYGTLWDSILCLFQSVSGGIDWRDAVMPLVDNVSPWLAPMFALYVAFVIFAMSNILTGVFVESALRCAKDENDLFMINNVRQVFLNIKGNLSGHLTLEDFERI